MPIDASIPLQVQPMQLMSPIQAQTNALNLRDLMQNSQMKQMQLQQGQMDLRNQQLLSQLGSVKENIDPATGTFTPEAISTVQDPAIRQKLTQQRMAALKDKADIDYKTSEAGIKADERKNEAVVGVWNAALNTHDDVLKRTGNKEAATEAFNKAQMDGYQELKDTGRGGFGKDMTFKIMSYDDVMAKVVSRKERLDAESKKAAEERGEETPFIKETKYLDQLKGQLASLKPGDPAAKQIASQIAQVQAHISKLDAPARTTVNMSGGPASIKGDALDLAADQLLIDGRLPAGFARNQANVGAIYKRAAEKAKEKGQTGEAALFNAKSIKSDQTSLSNLTKQADMITSFESTANKNLDMLVKQSDKIPRASWPLINKAILTGKLETGDPETAKFLAIVKPFVDEYAKILSGSTGSAGASDSARREAAEVLSPYFSQDQIKQLAPFIKQEMSNRTGSLSEQIDVIKSRMAGKPAPNPETTPSSQKAQTNTAPPAAIEHLKSNPALKDAFKAKYGYLPEGM